jgi:hypothetical protein
VRGSRVNSLRFRPARRPGGELLGGNQFAQGEGIALARTEIAIPEQSSGMSVSS